EQTSVTYSFGNLFVAGHHGAALAAGNVLDAVEAEADHVACRPDPAASPGTSECVSRVFDDAQARAAAKRTHRLEVAGAARIMHVHDRFRARRPALHRVFH